MGWQMPSAMLGATLASALLAATMYLLSRMPGSSSALRYYAAGFAANALRYLVSMPVFPSAGFLSALSESLHAAFTVLLMGGTYIFVGKPLSRRILFAGWLTASLWAGLAALVFRHYLLLTVPLYLFAAAVMIMTGLAWLGARRRNREAGYGAVGLGFILWGMHKLDYPWLSQVEWFRPVGFMIAEVLAAGLAIAVIILVQRQQRRAAAAAQLHAAESDRKVEASEQNLHSILSSLGDGVVTVDGDGIIRTINPAVENIFGYRAEELVGQPASMILPNPEAPNHPAGLLSPSVRESGQEWVGLHKDGRLVPVDLVVTEVAAGGGELHVGVIRDITERKLTDFVEDLVKEVNQAVIQGQSMDAILPAICERLVALFQLPLAWIAGKERDGTISIQAAAGEYTELLREIPMRWDDTPEGQGPVGKAIRLEANQVALIGEPQWEGRLDKAAGSGLATIVAMPLQVQRQAVGALVACGRSPFDPIMLRRLEILTLRLGIAMQIALDQQRLRLQGAAMAVAANAIFITDKDGRIEWVNRAFTRLSGFSGDEALGHTPRMLRSGVQTGEDYEDLWHTIQAGEVWRGELVERRKDGSLYTVDQTVTPMRDRDGRVAHFVVVHEDITERKRAEERIRYLSNYDSLTALPNRNLFRGRLDQAVARAKANRTMLAVLFLDLDNFSRINDTMGHEAGDRLLNVIVDRLTNAARAADTIARVGGDEFAIVQTEVAHAEAAAMVAQKVVDAVAQPVDLEGHEIHVSASIGISIYPNDGEDTDQLIKNADMAMYRAIREEPNSFRFFSNEMNAETEARLGLERDLRRAVPRNELVLFYQPQVCARTGRIMGLEALVRWRHPQLGLVSPASFIPIAEDSGLILPVGEWVLNEACRQIRRWQDAGLEPVPVAVNVAAPQLRQHDAVEKVQQALDQAGISPSLLEIEITESSVMQDAEAAQRLLSQISDLGIKLAIDDFGTGYSSLSYLKRFPVDKLKIDQSFVRDLTTDPNDAEIARAIITLGHSLGLRVVSEGVETEAQMQYLRQEGCDVLQGYLFSRPVPAEDVALMLAADPFVRA